MGARQYGRSFQYVDTLAQIYPDGDYPVLPGYHLPAAPQPFVQATWYPAAHATASWLAHLGLRGGYEMTVGSQLKYKEALYDQQSILWYAGLRGRIPVNLDDMGHGELGLLTTFANHTFSVSGLDDVFPDVDYKMLELGAEGEWRLNGLILGAYASYLLVLDSGAVAGDDWFKHSQTGGMHFGGNVGWELSRVVDILMGVDVRAYALDFNHVAASTQPDRVAGGATDQYFSAWAGLGFHIPADEPPPPTEEPSPSSARSVESTSEAFENFD